LRDFPNSGDEYAYLLSASLLAEGRLSVPSPEPREFFRLNHVINNGRFYGKYPPGWPVLLSVGVLAGAPWIINAILEVLTTLLLYRIAQDHFGSTAANVMLMCLLLNPYVIFTSASYFSHPSCLLFIVVFLYSALRSLDSPSASWPYVIMGASAGAAFLIRPFTAVAALLPLFFCQVVNVWRRYPPRVVFNGLMAAAVGFAPFAGLYLLYDWLQTGNPFLQPFVVYDPHDTLGFTGWYDDVVIRFRTTVVARLVDLNRWLPLSVPAFLIRSLSPARPLKELFLLVPPTGLLVGYFFYWGSGVFQYGPRYLYEAAGALLLVLGCVIGRAARLTPILVSTAVALNGWMSWSATVFHKREVQERMEVYDRVREAGITRAIVFLSTGSGTMPPADLTRNGIHFDAPILYVHDLGSKNTKLLGSYPDRTAYVYEYDARSHAGQLSRYSPPEALFPGRRRHAR